MTNKIFLRMLAIVWHTVEYPGGTLKLESEKNVGTTITAELLKR